MIAEREDRFSDACINGIKNILPVVATRLLDVWKTMSSWPACGSLRLQLTLTLTASVLAMTSDPSKCPFATEDNRQSFRGKFYFQRQYNKATVILMLILKRPQITNLSPVSYFDNISVPTQPRFIKSEYERNTHVHELK